MKKLLAIAIGVFGIIIFISAQAQAVTIVDTGPGPSGSGTGWSLGYWQWLAAKFDLSQTSTLTDIYGWMGTIDAGDLTVAIYKDAGILPDQSSPKLFSQDVSLAGSLPKSWYGISGINWTLSPDSYWVAFETKDTSQFYGYMPHPSLSPLTEEAFAGSDHIYRKYVYEDDILGLGVRIYGNEQGGPTVPEPATMSLLGLGLLGLVGFRRKK